jgi:2-iminobutanoate/2-iminopropanoate deaminase
VEGIELQTARTLNNLLEIVKAGGLILLIFIYVVGGKKEDIIKVTVFLTNWEDFQVMNKVYAEFFAGLPPPARATVAVAGLAAGAKIEMDAIAAV